MSDMAADILAAMEKVRDAPPRHHGGRDDPHVFHPRSVENARRLMKSSRVAPYLGRCVFCAGVVDIAAVLRSQEAS